MWNILFRDKFAAIEILEQMGMEEVPLDEDGAEQPLQENQYRWDKVCPLFMSCIPRDRGEFAQSEIVKNNYFIMQVWEITRGKVLIFLTMFTTSIPG